MLVWQAVPGWCMRSRSVSGWSVIKEHVGAYRVRTSARNSTIWRPHVLSCYASLIHKGYLFEVLLSSKRYEKLLSVATGSGSAPDTSSSVRHFNVFRVAAHAQLHIYYWLNENVFAFVGGILEGYWPATNILIKMMWSNNIEKIERQYKCATRTHYFPKINSSNFFILHLVKYTLIWIANNPSPINFVNYSTGCAVMKATNCVLCKCVLHHVW